MVLEPERGEEIALDVDLAGEVGLGEPQGVAAEQQAPQRGGVVQHQRELGRLLRLPAQPRRPVPESQPHAAGVGGKQTLQQRQPRRRQRRRAGDLRDHLGRAGAALVVGDNSS